MMSSSGKNNKKTNGLSDIALQSTSRVLNLLDRNPFSESFGCFDKYYWHFKTKDFPAASFQMGVEFLARLWSFPQSPWFRNPKLLQWIKGSLNYTTKIQHKDGSFDEWYPNERGWAGPTSYIVNALTETYTIVEEFIEENLKRSLQNCFSKAAGFLLTRDEGDILANHFALFLLSLHRVYRITENQKLKVQFESHLKRFFSHTSKEGWSLEYNGADFGYGLGTLGFLARIHKDCPHPLLKNHAKESFQFLSCFFYPDGSFGGGIGSRETVHLYPYAVKYWSQTIPTARAILRHLTEKKAFQKLTPSDQDDHYLFYRLSEYLECNSIKTKEDEILEKIPLLPFEREDNFQHYFPESGLFIKKTNTFYFVANLKKGGCFQMYSLSGKSLLKNYGWVTKFKNRKMATAFWIRENNQIHIKQNEISILGKMSFFHQRYFTPLKLILFRLITISLGWHAKGAFYLKRIIRKSLITSPVFFSRSWKDSLWSFFRRSKANKKEIRLKPNHYKRCIFFNSNNIEIIDSIFSEKVEKIFHGGNFTLRYVPQSNYFQDCDFMLEQTVFKGPFEKKRVFIRQVCYLKDFSTKVELCAESPDTFNSKKTVLSQ